MRWFQPTYAEEMRLAYYNSIAAGADRYVTPATSSPAASSAAAAPASIVSLPKPLAAHLTSPAAEVSPVGVTAKAAVRFDAASVYAARRADPTHAQIQKVFSTPAFQTTAFKPSPALMSAYEKGAAEARALLGKDGQPLLLAGAAPSQKSDYEKGAAEARRLLGKKA